MGYPAIVGRGTAVQEPLSLIPAPKGASPRKGGVSTGVRLNGFFAFCALPLPCGTSVVALNNPVTRASQSGGGGRIQEPGG